MWGFHSGKMHTDNCSPRDALPSNLLSLASGSCMLVPGACCGEPHLTMCSIILGNFSPLWNLLKSHFSMLSRQDSLLSCIGRTCLCVSLKDRLETTERPKQQDSGRGKEKIAIYTVSLPKDKWLSGRSKEAAALRQLSVNWGKNINWKVQTCALMWGYWNQSLTFVIQVSWLVEQFPVATFTWEKE